MILTSYHPPQEKPGDVMTAHNLITGEDRTYLVMSITPVGETTWQIDALMDTEIPLDEDVPE